MSIYEFKYKVALIKQFILKLDRDSIPTPIKKTAIKVYAKNLNIKLTDNTIDTII